MGFRRIFYDSYHNKLYTWTTEFGKDIITPKFTYYVEDKTKKSLITLGN